MTQPHPGGIELNWESGRPHVGCNTLDKISIGVPCEAGRTLCAARGCLLLREARARGQIQCSSPRRQEVSAYPVPVLSMKWIWVLSDVLRVFALIALHEFFSIRKATVSS